MRGDLYELALTVPWCVTDEALEAMLSIAARDPLPDEEIARRLHGPKALALRSGPRHEDSRTMRLRDGVATIPIDGPIYRYADFFTNVSGGVTTDALGRDLGTALDDPAVGAILLMIDSPGGEATGINELADTIYAARGRKPIVAYIEGYGASAAYWIASAADLVVADDTALIGSIGTVMGVPDPAKRISRTIDFVSTQSPRKRPDPTQDTGRAYLQQLVDDMTDVFVSKVARNRALETSAVLAVEGGMLVGRHAVAAGLADTLGSEEQVHLALARGYPVRQLIERRSIIVAQPRIQEVGSMSENKGFWAWVKGDPATAPAPDQPSAASAMLNSAPALQLSTAPTAAAQQQPDPRAEQIAAENAELRKQMAKFRAEQIQKDAAAFAASELAAGHALPAEKESIVALYARAAEVDASQPRDDGQPSCVALVQAAYSNRPAHVLSKPLIEGTPLKQRTVLANAGGADEADVAQAKGSAVEYANQRNGTKKK